METEKWPKAADYLLLEIQYLFDNTHNNIHKSKNY